MQVVSSKGACGVSFMNLDPARTFQKQPLCWRARGEAHEFSFKRRRLLEGLEPATHLERVLRLAIDREASDDARTPVERYSPQGG